MLDFNFGGRSPKDISLITSAAAITGILSTRWVWEIVSLGHPMISTWDFILITIAFLMLNEVS